MRPQVFYKQYIEYQGVVHDEARRDAEEIGRGWVSQAADSGLTAASYLKRLSDEYRESLHQTMLHADFLNPVRQLMRDFERETPGSQVEDILGALQFRTARRLYLDRLSADASLGSYAIAYASRLISAINAERLQPQEAFDMLDEFAVDESHARFARVVIDWRIFHSAFHAKSAEAAKSKISVASSDASRAAMNIMLDEKVLKEAIRLSKLSTQESVNLIMEFASSYEAREAMIDYLSRRVTGSNPRRVRSHYAYRLGDFDARVHRRSWEQFQDEQERRQTEREARTGRSYQEESFVASFDTVTNDVLRRIALSLDRKFRESLLSFDADDVARVIEKVKRLRDESPHLTAQNIYRRFHFEAQFTDAAAKVTEDTQILALLLQGDFSKTAKLPF